MFGRVERLAVLKRKGQATGDETQRPNSWEVAWPGEENDVGYSCPLAKWGLLDRAEVVHALAARNAIRYLAQNIEQGIVTPLTYAYRDAILRRTGTTDLTEARLRC